MQPSLRDASLAFMDRLVADAMDQYEPRPSQQAMTAACADVVDRGGTLMVEAGTGTGKTFAYLVPIIISGKKALIATRTINLQEQLASKDLRFLAGLTEFSYAVAKGRGNFLCLRRLQAAGPENDDEAAELGRIREWAAITSTGDVEDFGIVRFPLWDRLSADPDACTKKACPLFGRCFYYNARKRWEEAQIIVANHAIVAIDALLTEDAKLFPQTEILVVDEGHAFDHALTEHVGVTLSNRLFDMLLNRLLKVSDRGTYKGLLCRSPALFPVVEQFRGEAGRFWQLVRERFTDRQTIPDGFALESELRALAASLDGCVEAVRSGDMGLFEEDEEIELRAALLKLKAVALDLETFADGCPDCVRWTEVDDRRVALRLAPLYPRDFVRQAILPMHESIVVTSATLSVGGDFGFFKHLLGLDEATSLALPSPFDLRRQVDLEILKDIDLRNDPRSSARLAEVIVDEAERAEGGVLVLFTSREAMRRTWDLTSRSLRSLGRTAMMQGDELSNREMLKVMRSGTDAVIFGLDSFWEGVDVRGDALKTLIITKLPFEVPTEPIAMARTRDIEKRGGNPFMEYSLPKAVIKFKQGFGRLIRSKTDTGRVVICDARIETKRYGRVFLESLF